MEILDILFGRFVIVSLDDLVQNRIIFLISKTGTAELVDSHIYKTVLFIDQSSMRLDVFASCICLERYFLFNPFLALSGNRFPFEFILEVYLKFCPANRFLSIAGIDVKLFLFPVLLIKLYECWISEDELQRIDLPQFSLKRFIAIN